MSFHLPVQFAEAIESLHLTLFPHSNSSICWAVVNDVKTLPLYDCFNAYLHCNCGTKSASLFCFRWQFSCLSRQSDMAAQCVTKVELTVSCDNLMDKDIGSKSDPLCVLLMSSSDSKWYEVSRFWRVVIAPRKCSGIWIWNTFPSLDKEVIEVSCEPWTPCCIKQL